MSDLPRRVLSTQFWACLVILFWSGGHCLAEEPPAQAEPGHEFESQIRPLLARYCSECHSQSHAEGEIDLSGFRTPADLRKQVKLWQKVRQILEQDQMPPPDAPQPSEDERRQLRDWVRSFLATLARQHAGDPGPVMLRRLTNAEYNYTIRDLTGIASLDATREFPVDGAAGEGFTNVGAGQGMSPSLISKYLEAAKEVAAHLVLLPEGIRFSEKTTQRDQTDEILGRIQALYRRYTADGGGTTVNLDGNPFATNQGGLLPLEKYLEATLAERDRLQTGAVTLEKVAAERKLSAKYLRTLWEALNAPLPSSNPLLDEARRLWQDASAGDAPRLAAWIGQWQSVLWRFNSIGHIGRAGSPSGWMEPLWPLVSNQEIRVSLPDEPEGEDVIISLTASEFDGGPDENLVIWRRPRLEFPADAAGRPHAPVLLRDIAQLVPRVEQTQTDELPRTAEYLAALVGMEASRASVPQTAMEHDLDPELLTHWAVVTGIATPTERNITGHFTRKLVRVQGYDAINGWSQDDLPSLLTNRSDEAIQFLTLTVPARGVTVHPSPTLDAVVTWQSPVETRLNIDCLIADADDKCGNGVSWKLVLQTTSERRVLWDGEFDDGGSKRFRLKTPIEVFRGDLISLIVSPRGGNHACDTTHVNLTLSEHGDKPREWDLASDVVDNVLQGNPLPDRHGFADVWHFCQREGTAEPATALVAGSLLARWRTALDEGQSPDDLHRLANAIELVLTRDEDSLEAPDRQQRQLLLDWTGPLDWLGVARSVEGAVTSDYGIAAQRFGRAGRTAVETDVDDVDLCLPAPHRLEVRLPGQLVRGAQFVATGILHNTAGQAGSAQLQVLTSKQPADSFKQGGPILVPEESLRSEDLRGRLDEFRELFPPALCYARIVPVDEVVTLTLFHREDHHLKRLMLDDEQAAELDRLWKELSFVSQEPLKLVVAFEQISEFATQDRPDLVEAFAPLRQPILDRAEAFRQQMRATEPSHVDGVVEFAERAWRRPLTGSQQQDLHRVYQQLRDNEIAHDETIRLLLARVLTAPAYLYKLEQPGRGHESVPVSDHELATRLSYFLWSSLPDAPLLQAAGLGYLKQDDILRAQTRRMLHDPRTRRLAIHFACQWLHVRDFDQLVEKNEQLYPQFTALRTEMNEETVRFFEDLFRNDGSILELLEADHTFLTPTLARHYGLDVGADPGWQRVEGLRGQGRGGILGMASALASQSGASRTSPILRGTWVSETLLGERLPRPPAGVPQLPEAVPQNLTARQLIERHSSAPECATCHRKIDPYGFALEQFDTIGRIRPQPADTRTTLIDGQQIDGLDGLRDYLLHERREDFIRQFCRKLLGYALGREVQLSDEPLLDEIHAKLKEGDYRFSIAIEAIVTSRQFRDIRGQDQSVANEPL